MATVGFVVLSIALLPGNYDGLLLDHRECSLALALI